MGLNQVVFSYGTVVNFSDLPGNAVALDGYCQGPAIDPAGRRFSFDHHAGVIRLVTKATCEQVREAICLGLPLDKRTRIYCNDLDADTVLSVWFLLHPERVWDYNLIVLCAQVGRTDAHGPLFRAHPLHREITPLPKWHKDYKEQSLALLSDLLAKVDQFAAGEWVEPTAQQEEPSHGWGWNMREGWKAVEVADGFDGFYRAGWVFGFLYEQNPDGSYAYTVAKASDLVAVDLGPGSKVRPMTDIGQTGPTVLGALARAEQAKNPGQSLAATWGGGTSIGGGPRNADGSGSCLTPEEVFNVVRVFTPNFVKAGDWK
jgi:hypothetical protein